MNYITNMPIALSVCAFLSGCSCLSVYSDTPTNIFSSSYKNTASAQIDGEILVLNRNVVPSVINTFYIWINYEVVGGKITASGRETAAVFVNGSPIVSIPYNNEEGFKATGKVELTKFMSPGINTVEIVITHGQNGDVKLRGSRTGVAEPLGQLQHACFAGKDPSKESITAFQVDYRPTIL